MRKFYFGAALAVAALLPSFASAQIGALRTGDVRITGDLDELPGGGNAGDENGGFTGLVLGANTGNVENWALFGFDLTSISAPPVIGAEFIVDVNQGFTNANHGDSGNSFSIFELHGTNSGWLEGGQGIQNTVANVANPGVVTFQQQAFGSTDWQDAAGANVDNFMDAFGPTPLATIPAYNQGAGPAQLSFQFSAAQAQAWLSQGFADLVIEVDDPDGLRTSRFVVNNNTAQLNILVVPEPSSAAMLGLMLGGFVMRRKRS